MLPPVSTASSEERAGERRPGLECIDIIERLASFLSPQAGF